MDDDAVNKLQQTALMSLFGLVGSMIIGYLFFRGAIFSPHNSAFQFVLSGFFMALSLAVLEHYSVKQMMLLLPPFILLELVVLTGRNITAVFILRDILFFTSISASAYLYYIFVTKAQLIPYYVRSFALVFIYALFNSIAALLLFLSFSGRGHSFPVLWYLLAMARYAGYIGFGVGLGTDLYLQQRERLFALLKLYAGEENEDEEDAPAGQNDEKKQ